MLAERHTDKQTKTAPVHCEHTIADFLSGMLRSGWEKPTAVPVIGAGFKGKARPEPPDSPLPGESLL